MISYRYLPNTFALRERLETKAMRKIAREEDDATEGGGDKDKDKDKDKIRAEKVDKIKAEKEKPNSIEKQKSKQNVTKSGSFKDLASKVLV